MSWGDESPEQTARMELERLAPAKVLDQQSAETIGIGAGAPHVQPVGEGGGAGEVQASAGSNSYRRRLSPRHRKAVRRFFSPKGESDTSGGER